MNLNLSVQLILAQLNNLYKTQGSFGLYDLVYDFLLAEKHDLNLTPEKKTELWEKSKLRFNKERKTWINSGQIPIETITKELHKYYKSHLTAEYLLNIEKLTGQRLDILDNQGNKITLLTITERHEKN